MYIVPTPQRENDECVMANIVALTGLPYDQVKAEFHHKYHNWETNIAEYLTSKGCVCSVPQIHEGQPVRDVVDFCIAPALDSRPLFHSILLDSTKDGFTVHDPADRDGLPHYAVEPVEPGERKLEAWVVECRVYYVPGDLRDGD